MNGAPFYVMSFVEGRVVRDEKDAAELSEGARAHAGESLIDTLAALHAVDVDAVGLGDFARREDYIARQLKRWHGQFSQSTVDGEPGPAVVDRVHATAGLPGPRTTRCCHRPRRLPAGQHRP